MLEVSLTALERADAVDTAVGEVAALRAQIVALTARVRQAERRAELLEESRRTLLAVAWGGRPSLRP